MAPNAWSFGELYMACIGCVEVPLGLWKFMRGGDMAPPDTREGLWTAPRAKTDDLQLCDKSRDLF